MATFIEAVRDHILEAVINNGSHYWNLMLLMFLAEVSTRLYYLLVVHRGDTHCRKLQAHASLTSRYVMHYACSSELPRRGFNIHFDTINHFPKPGGLTKGHCPFNP